MSSKKVYEIVIVATVYVAFLNCCFQKQKIVLWKKYFGRKFDIKLQFYWIIKTLLNPIMKREKGRFEFSFKGSPLSYKWKSMVSTEVVIRDNGCKFFHLRCAIFSFLIIVFILIAWNFQWFERPAFIFTRKRGWTRGWTHSFPN